MASPAAEWLNATPDSARRAIVEPDLTLPGRKDVFVIGDTASVHGLDGAPLSALAPVAKRQGAYVSRGGDPTTACRPW